MAKTCRQCNEPSCVPKCPAHVDIPKFVGEIARGGRDVEAFHNATVLVVAVPRGT